MMWEKTKIFLLIVFYNGLCLILGPALIFGVLIQPISLENLNGITDFVFNIFFFFLGIWALTFLINAYTTTPKYDKKYKQILLKDALDVGILHPCLTGPTLVKIPAVRGQFYAAQIAFPGLTKKKFFYRPCYRWFAGRDLRREASLFNYLLAYLLCVSSFLFIGFLVLGAIMQLISYVV